MSSRTGTFSSYASASRPAAVVKKDRERSLRRRHPWIYSGAIDRVEGSPQAGDAVRVRDHSGAFVAWGYFNPRSKIQVRVLDWEESAVIDESWWRDRLSRAIARREGTARGGDAYRLVHAEADGLPGLIVDRYGDYLVVQVLTMGMERLRGTLLEILSDLVKPAGIYERSEGDSREIEGLEARNGPVMGEEPPELIEIHEGPHRFLVDVRHGHKTGFYVDQAENRRLVAPYASGRSVLDAFCYTAAFGVSALAAGASALTLIESSQPALELARRNLALNGFPPENVEVQGGNAFEVLRAYRDQGRTFGLVVLDPPKFAPTKSRLSKAERAYKDVNLLAMRLLEPGGFLATFSCSGAIGPELFTRIVAWASIDARRDVRVLRRLSQGSDHPMVPTFPESEYLTGLLCEVS